jgi:hypothetical protein
VRDGSGSQLVLVVAAMLVLICTGLTDRLFAWSLVDCRVEQITPACVAVATCDDGSQVTEPYVLSEAEPGRPRCARVGDAGVRSALYGPGLFRDTFFTRHPATVGFLGVIGIGVWAVVVMSSRPRRIGGIRVPQNIDFS